MDGMHGEQQSGHERRSLRLRRSPENRLQQQVQQPSDCRVQHEIEQVKPERLPSIHRLIPCQRCEGDPSNHVVDLMRRKPRSHLKVCPEIVVCGEGAAEVNSEEPTVVVDDKSVRTNLPTRMAPSIFSSP